MADPQTNPIEWQPGQRWDPSTGQAQWFNRGNWQDVGTVQYDPHTGQITQNGQPIDPRVNTQFNVGSSTILPNIEQLRMMSMLAAQRQALQQQAGPGAPAPTGIQAAPSYWGTGMQSGIAATPVTPGATGATGASGATGATGASSATGAPSAQTGGSNMAATTTAGQFPTGLNWEAVSPNDIAQWQTWYGRNVGKTILVNGQPRTIGTDIQPQEMLDAFRQNTVGFGAMPGPQAPTQTIGGAGQVQPETAALAQMAQIDPATEALRQGLGASYLANLGGGPPAPQFGGMPQFGLDLSRGAAAPAAGDVQSYLNLYKQIDPQGYAQRVALAGGMDKFVQQAQAQRALGSQLDPGTIREVEQGTRAAQIARGNVYGTPQLVAETMARGSAGEQRLQQREQMLQSALGQQQSYLGSGLGLGDVANTLYNQGYNRYLQGYGTQANAALQGYGAQLQGWQAQQQARLQAQGAALGYLGSGQTPYQAGASYLGAAEQRAGMAAQGGPQYQPAALGQQYTGAGAPSFPQYGLDMSQLAGNWYNNINQANLQAYGLGQAYGQRGGGGSAMGAGIGALGGAASGALAGSAIPGIGTAIGAGIGAIGGAASGYFK
jgi:hypothetical protein